MVYHYCTHDTLVSCATCKYTIHKASTVCVLLGYNLKFSRFQDVKKERRVNAFQKICRWQGCCRLPLSLSLPASPLTVAWLLLRHFCRGAVCVRWSATANLKLIPLTAKTYAAKHRQPNAVANSRKKTWS